MTRRFLVTGATGFIGGRVCAALREHGRVVALVRNAAATGPWDEIVVGDLLRDDIPPRPFEGVDVVYHFGGRAHAVAERVADVELYQRVNVEGTLKVLAAARAAGVRRFIFASSVKAMGEGYGDATLSPYGRSKLDAEVIVRASGMESVVLRPSLVYGSRVEGNLGGMLRAVKAGRFPPPPPVANRRSMVHVDDVVRVAIAAGDHAGAAGQTFVLGDGVAYSTRDIYDAMVRALGKQVPPWALPLPFWTLLAFAGDACGAILGRRAPFDREAYRKLFGSAWYPASDVQAALGVPRFATLSDALPDMVRSL